MIDKLSSLMTETKNNLREVNHNVSNHFDPDKRIDVNRKVKHNEIRSFDPDKRIDYYTPIEERIKHCPSEFNKYGRWDGGRGESYFIPNKDTIQGKNFLKKLKKFKETGILYKGGYPDFSKVAHENVNIDNMTDDRYKNFKKADECCAKKWNVIHKDGKDNWSARDVKEYREEHKLTWHEHQNLKTCQLVDRDIHDICKHAGGYCEYKHKYGKVGGIFDE